MRRTFLLMLSVALTAQTAPPGADALDSMRSLTNDDLVRYARYRKKALKGLASWNEKKNQQALESTGLTEERVRSISRVDGYYMGRFLARQTEHRLILLRASVVGCRKQEAPCSPSDEAQWHLQRAQLASADADRAEFAKRAGAELQALLDRHEETYLELVALGLDVPWGRSPDPGAIRLEARRPLE